MYWLRQGQECICSDTLAELSNFQGKKYYYPNLRAAFAYQKINANWPFFVPEATFLSPGKQQALYSSYWSRKSEQKKSPDFHHTLILKSLAIIGLPNRYSPKRSVGCPR